MEFMLSLASNPYNPFTEYGLWLNYDRSEGFNTPGLLARLIAPSDALSDVDQDRDVEVAIDSIVNNPNFSGLYKKVQR